MSVITMSSCCISSGHCVSAQQVFALSYGLKVSGINASLVLTEVVNHKPGLYWPTKDLPC